VWTNTLAGVLLASPGVSAWVVALLAFAFSLFYVGGMFLNDAFDRETDARERPERPIPAGLVSAAEAFWIGFGMLFLGTAIVALYGSVSSHGGGLHAVASATALATAIVLYDAWHKGNPLGPLLMGACRVLVYLTAALAAAGRLGAPVLVGAGLLLAYLMGMTYLAKQERLTRLRKPWMLILLLVPLAATATTIPRHALAAILWVAFLAWIARTLAPLRSMGTGVIPRVVVRLIAAISLLDALLIAGLGANCAAVAAVGGFGMTLFLQRYVRGT
jgi:4-hydroxybenzoate polyprenyltransferase